MSSGLKTNYAVFFEVQCRLLALSFSLGLIFLKLTARKKILRGDEGQPKNKLHCFANMHAGMKT